MSWDDIDLDIIKKGMITRSTQPGDEESEQASMTDILNQFSQAANERLNMMLIDPEDLEIEFFKGEIRNKDFWDKYRDLIVLYFRIMSGNHGVEIRQNGGFYREAVMTDPINHEDHKYTVDDFKNELGEDIYDIIRDGGAPTSYTISQIFLADVLQGFYKIYEMTGIYANGLRLPIGTPQVNRLVIIEDEGDYLEAEAVKGSPGGTYAETKDLLNWVAKVDPFPTSYAIFFQSTRFSFSETNTWEIQGRDPTTGGLSRPNLRSKNNQQIIYKAQDLESNILEMEFTGFGIMDFNFTEGDDYPPENSTPFDSSFPFEGGSTNSTEVEWPIISETQEAEGSAIVLGIKNGDSPIPETPVTGNGVNQTDWFNQQIDQLIFVRINNEALDFHIADE